MSKHTFKIGDRFNFTVASPQRNPAARWRRTTYEYVVVDLVDEGYVACNRSSAYEVVTFRFGDEDRMVRI